MTATRGTLSRHGLRTHFIAAHLGLALCAVAGAPRECLGAAVTELPAHSFPVVITQPGTYCLTGSVTVARQGTNGITVLSDDVRIDLRGFTLEGPGAGGGAGIFLSDDFSRLSITNGILSGWGSASNAPGYGLLIMGRKARLDFVTATACGTGIRAGRFSTLTYCTAYSNAVLGFRLDQGTAASECTAYGNRTGFDCRRDGELRLCTSFANDQEGFVFEGDSDVDSCTASGNGLGMRLGNGTEVQGSVANDNRGIGFDAASNCVIQTSSANENGADGIHALTACEIRRCTVHANKGAGVRVTGTGNHIAETKATENESGFVALSKGNSLSQNISGNNRAASYNVADVNSMAPVLSEAEALATSNGQANIDLNLKWSSR